MSSHRGTTPKYGVEIAQKCIVLLCLVMFSCTNVSYVLDLLWTSSSRQQGLPRVNRIRQISQCQCKYYKMSLQVL